MKDTVMSVGQGSVCPVCNGVLNKYLDGVKDIHYRIKELSDVYRCNTCGFQATQMNVSGDSTNGVYEDESYYAYDEPNNEGVFWKLSKYWMLNKCGYDTSTIKLNLIERLAYIAFLPHFANHLWWFPHQTSKGLSFIDIGCGGGKIVKFMGDLGYESWGTDVSSYGGGVGEKHDLKVVVGDFRCAEIPEDYFEYLYTRHALEHIKDPNTTFRKISELLKKGGVGFISVPNADSLTAKIFGRYWYFLGAPLHVVNYTPKSIRIMLEKNGMEIIKIKVSADYLGLIGSLQAYINRDTDKTSAEGWVMNSIFMKGLGQLIAYVANLINQGSHLQVQFRRK